MHIGREVPQQGPQTLTSPRALTTATSRPNVSPHSLTPHSTPFSATSRPGSPPINRLLPSLSGDANQMADFHWFIHVLALCTPVGITVVYWKGLLFSAHVGLMGLAYLLVQPEGLLVAIKAIRHKQRAQLMRLHMYLQLSSIFLAMVGLGAQFLHRQQQGKRHFKGLHSLLGLGTIFLTQVVALVGLLLYYGIPKARRASMPRVLALHRVGGRVVFILGVITVLEALKVFDHTHHRHKGRLTYVLGCSLVAQAVGMLVVMFPFSAIAPPTLRGRGLNNGGLPEQKMGVSSSLLGTTTERMSGVDVDKDKD
eukprot:TRINITY_DN643_c0_g1_i1.p1 TRINITY_DN643_c0_g1~~TRINITY_DN643_c0_g1_i1.p1  ORF type:complete len:310 (+),score=37.66 TRINITY_DN643_c0_g1_i1:204-1133(+)